MLRSGKSGAGIWVRRIEFARADSKQPTLSPTGPFTLEGWVNCDRITGATGGTVAMKGPDAEAPADRGALDWLIAQAEAARFHDRLELLRLHHDSKHRRLESCCDGVRREHPAGLR
jgi:hypothetical protein